MKGFSQSHELFEGQGEIALWFTGLQIGVKQKPEILILWMAWSVSMFEMYQLSRLRIKPISDKACLEYILVPQGVYFM